MVRSSIVALLLAARLGSTVASANKTTSGPSPTCSSNCQMKDGLNMNVMRWRRQFFFTAIPAVRIVLVIDQASNTTSTKTEYLPLPSGHALPPTNSLGTVLATATAMFEEGKTTTIAYPTEYTDYYSTYGWNGTLATSGGGKSLCVTAKGSVSTVTLPSHPQPGPTTFPSDIKLPLSVVTASQTIFYSLPGEGDVQGLFYETYWDDFDASRASSFHVEVFPGEAAFTNCEWPIWPLPATALASALFLTETSSSFVSRGKSATPAPKQPETSSPSKGSPTNINGATPTKSQDSPARSSVLILPQSTPATPASTTPPPKLTTPAVGTINGVTYSVASENSHIIVGTQTLVPGSAITLGQGVSATTVSLIKISTTANGVTTTGLQLVAGTSTVQIPTPGQSSDAGSIGGIIYSGLDGPGSEPSASGSSGSGPSGAAQFPGESPKIGLGMDWIACLFFGILIQMLL